jgi:hypothetical protein
MAINANRKSTIYQGLAQKFHVEYVKQWKNTRHYLDTVMLLKDWNNEHKGIFSRFRMEISA